MPEVGAEIAGLRIHRNQTHIQRAFDEAIVAGLPFWHDGRRKVRHPLTGGRIGNGVVFDIHVPTPDLLSRDRIKLHDVIHG